MTDKEYWEALKSFEDINLFKDCLSAFTDLLQREEEGESVHLSDVFEGRLNNKAKKMLRDWIWAEKQAMP